MLACQLFTMKTGVKNRVTFFRSVVLTLTSEGKTVFLLLCQTEAGGLLWWWTRITMHLWVRMTNMKLQKSKNQAIEIWRTFHFLVFMQLRTLQICYLLIMPVDHSFQSENLQQVLAIPKIPFRFCLLSRMASPLLPVAALSTLRIRLLTGCCPIRNLQRSKSLIIFRFQVPSPYRPQLFNRSKNSKINHPNSSSNSSSSR